MLLSIFRIHKCVRIVLELVGIVISMIVHNLVMQLVDDGQPKSQHAIEAQQPV